MDLDQNPGSLADLAADPGTPAAVLTAALMSCHDPAQLPVALHLTTHDDPQVRRAAAQALPHLTDEPAAEAVVDALVTLTTDPWDDVRDWACFALGTQLSEADGPRLRDALAARLSDPHDETRCEALVGLARRRDSRVLPVLLDRLADDNVLVLEVEAAGALGDARLYPLVLRHLADWSGDSADKVCAALRLTDPDGVGDDLLDGLAEWYRSGCPDRRDDDQFWWTVTLGLLDLAEDRAVEIAAGVAARLDGDDAARLNLARSALTQLARDHGWTA
ncbi:MAG TPA: HEAT repeat domain-containing protein [Micromonosporaceae bacterium]